MKIMVGSNLFAVIDKMDADLVKSFRWIPTKKPNGRVYARAYFRKSTNAYTTIAMHRLILGLKNGDKSIVDHINHDTLDNRRKNLRVCTPSENVTNRRSFDVSKTSKYRGVSWKKRDKKWDVKVTKNGKHFRMGAFEIEIEAALAYNKKAKELHGEFAVLNNV